MLVVSRKLTEAVEIRPSDGSMPIIVAIVNVKGRNVKLGIKAPGIVKILRTKLEPKADET